MNCKYCKDSGIIILFTTQSPCVCQFHKKSQWNNIIFLGFDLLRESLSKSNNPSLFLYYSVGKLTPQLSQSIDALNQGVQGIDLYILSNFEAETQGNGHIHHYLKKYKQLLFVINYKRTCKMGQTITRWYQKSNDNVNPETLLQAINFLKQS